MAVFDWDDMEGGQDFSFTGSNSWSPPDDFELAPVYADESFYEQTGYSVPGTGISRDVGEQITQTGQGMSSGGTVDQYAEVAEADRDPDITSTQLDTSGRDGIKSYERVSGEYTPEQTETQLGGTQFDWRDYKPGGQDTQRGEGGVIPDYDPVTGFALPTYTGISDKDALWEAQKPKDVLSLTQDQKDQKAFFDNLSGMKKTGRAFVDIPGASMGWFTADWVKNNWDQIKNLQSVIAEDPYGPGFTMENILPYIQAANDARQGNLPPMWSGQWKSLDDSTEKRLGPTQKKIMDFWTKTDPVQGFYGKTFQSEKINIAGHRDIQATSWEGVIDYFTNLQGTNREVPMEFVLYELQRSGQNFPRTTVQGDELGEMVGQGLKVPPKDPLDPKAPQARNIGTSLNKPLDIIWQQFSAGIIENPKELEVKLLNAFANAMYPGGWEDKAVTWQRMQEGMAEGGGTWGGATQDQMDKAELWAIGVIKQMVADKAANFQGTYEPKSPPPPEVVDTTVTGRDFPMPKNADEALAILNTLSREDDNFDMIYEMYNMYARQGGGGGTGTGTEQDLQSKLTNATITINALRQSADLTAQQHGLLNDWEREMQGESQRLRKVEADRLGTQQQLERDRMTAETTGMIGTDPTFEKQLFQQRGEQEAAAAGRAETLAQTTAEAEASRLKIAEGGIASQAQQAQAATDQVANAHRIAEAQLSGWLAGYGDTRGVPTLAATELRNTQALKEAEMSGTLWQQIGDLNEDPDYKGVETIAMRTFTLNKDIAERKMTLEREIAVAASRREDTRMNYENTRMRNQSYIEQGQLEEAVISRREMNRIKEIELEDARNTMRLNTLVSLMNPVAMLMAQRMGMIPQLEAAMGIDLDIPEIAPMLPEGMSVPTAQMLNLFSPQDQQLIMAESSFRTGLSQEDISSVIHRQRPGAPGGQMLSYGGGR